MVRIRLSMKKVTIYIAIAAILSSCASSSGVLTTGPDTYTISTSASPGRGGVPEAIRMAYQEAGAECTRQGREILVLDEKSSSPTWTEGMAKATVQFRCLLSNDPEYKRPESKTNPDATIEIQ
jgi:hypothetical protein